MAEPSMVDEVVRELRDGGVALVLTYSYEAGRDIDQCLEAAGLEGSAFSGVSVSFTERLLAAEVKRLGPPVPVWFDPAWPVGESVALRHAMREALAQLGAAVEVRRG